MNYDILLQSPLFQSYSLEKLQVLLQKISYYTKNYSKGEVLLHTGELVSSLGLVLSGKVQVESIDVLGNKSILGFSSPGDIFAEAYACLPNQPLGVDVVCIEDSEILYIPVHKLFSSTDATQLVYNLLRMAAQKNVNLSRRIFHTSSKTIRGRLLSYFSEQVAVQKRKDITIPLDRQQLADYLGVERTALSKELGKMKKEGLIDFHKNQFVIYGSNI